MSSPQHLLDKLKEGGTIVYQGQLYQRVGRSLIPVKSKAKARDDQPRTDTTPAEALKLADTNLRSHSQNQPLPTYPESYQHRSRPGFAESGDGRTSATEQSSRRDGQSRTLRDNEAYPNTAGDNNGRTLQSRSDVNTLSTGVEGLDIRTRTPQLQVAQMQSIHAREARDDSASRHETRRSTVPTRIQGDRPHDRTPSSRHRDGEDANDGEMYVEQNDFKYLDSVAREFARIPFLDFEQRAEFAVDHSLHRHSNLTQFLKEAVWQKHQGRLDMARLCTQSLVLLKLWQGKRARDIFARAEDLTNQVDEEKKDYIALYRNVESVIEKDVADKAKGSNAATLPPERASRESFSNYTALPPVTQDLQRSTKAGVRRPSTSDQYNPRLNRIEADEFRPSPDSAQSLQRLPDANHTTGHDGAANTRLPGIYLQTQQPMSQNHQRSTGYGAAQEFYAVPELDPDDSRTRSVLQTTRKDSTTDRSQAQNVASGQKTTKPDYRAQSLQAKDLEDIEDFLNRISNVGTEGPRLEIVPPEKFSGEDAPEMRALSSLYKVPQNGKTFFEPGRVFAILWSQPAGQPLQFNSRKTISALEEPVPEEKLPYNVTYGPHGQQIFSQIRRMVVIRNRNGYCWCVSIGTYGGRGLGKKGLKQSEIDAHAIVYDSKENPMYLRGEPRTVKRPIAVDMARGQTLDIASRLHFAKPFSVEWNTRVMNVGQVTERCMGALLYDAVDELFGELPTRRA